MPEADAPSRPGFPVSKEMIAIITIGLTLIAILLEQRIAMHANYAEAMRATEAVRAEAADDRRAFQNHAADDRREFQRLADAIRAEAAGDRREFQRLADAIRAEASGDRRAFQAEILRLTEAVTDVQARLRD